MCVVHYILTGSNFTGRSVGDGYILIDITGANPFDE